MLSLTLQRLDVLNDDLRIVHVVFILGLIALLDPYLFKSCGYGPLTNLNTKQTLMF